MMRKAFWMPWVPCPPLKYTAATLPGHYHIEEYIGAHLNNFLSSGRNPLHIDSEAYRLLADFVWIVRRKDLSISGMASRIIIDHFKEKGGLIEKIKEFYKKQLD